jgi:hypothetical protein
MCSDNEHKLFNIYFYPVNTGSGNSVLSIWSTIDAFTHETTDFSLHLYLKVAVCPPPFDLAFAFLLPSLAHIFPSVPLSALAPSLIDLIINTFSFIKQPDAVAVTIIYYRKMKLLSFFYIIFCVLIVVFCWRFGYYRCFSNF